MSWPDALPAILTCLAWLFLPGLAMSAALGLRGLTALAIAPAASAGALGTAAIVFGLAGVPWTQVSAALAALVAVLGCLAVGWLLRRAGNPAVGSLSGKHWVALAVGGLITAGLGWRTFAEGTGGLDRIAQAFDAVFHYAGLAAIMERHNGSGLALNSLINPLVPGGGFYPAAWHDLASLAAWGSGADVIVVSNVLALLVAVVVFPLTMTLLVRQILGPQTGVYLLTPVIAVCFQAFPWTLISYGTLWPNALGIALVPVGLAAVVSLAGLARQDAIGKPRAWLLVLLTVVGTGLAHPNATFSLAVMAAPIVFFGLLGWARGRGALRYLAVAGAVLLAAGAALVVDRMPAFYPVKRTLWPPIQNAPDAVWAVLTNSTNRTAPAYALSVLMLIGVLIAVCHRRERWLVLNFALVSGLYVVAAWMVDPVKMHITGYWYNNAPRLSAMIPLVTVPLVMVTLLYTARLVESLSEWIWNRRPFLLSSTVLMTLAVLVLGLQTDFYRPQLAAQLAQFYRVTDDRPDDMLVDDQERDLYREIARVVPADAVIAANPWNGSTMLFPLAGRHVLYGTLLLTDTGSDRSYLANHLNRAATDPRVCPLVRELHVSYLLSDPEYYWSWDPNTNLYPGLDDPRAAPGFTLVAEQGRHRLYKISACEPRR
ncbi:hypothetical protein D5S17_15830 [Pseudonocardiaceae bacterium YIM PH 21723]|nr:hypothetical protein D5S17_15830 [Pseudonocardiaceae bacterium YIM PH 21723]